MTNIDEIERLKAELADKDAVLEFYADNQSWLYNEIKKSDCDVQFFVGEKPVPKGLEFESGGKSAREVLQKYRKSEG